jgi:hypothetical protein
MDALECVKTSPPLPRCLLDIVEKVIRVVLVPFALIIDFFINLVRSVANTCISLANWVLGPVPNAPPIPVRSGENGALEIVATPVVEEVVLEANPEVSSEVSSVSGPAPSHAEEIPMLIPDLLVNREVLPPGERTIADGPSSQVMQEASPASMTQLTTSISPSGTSATSHLSVTTAEMPRSVNASPPNMSATTSSNNSSTISVTTTQASKATTAPPAAARTLAGLPPNVSATTSSNNSSTSSATTTQASKATTAPSAAARTLAGLPCTELQERQICELVSILGTKNKASIVWNEKKKLSDLGAAIRGIHPLKFLSIACNNAKGISHIQAIFSDAFKYYSFMSYSNSTTPSFTCKLEAEAKKDNLEPYLKELVEVTAQITNVKLAVIQKDVKEKKWDNLVKHLAGIQVP